MMYQLVQINLVSRYVHVPLIHSLSHTLSSTRSHTHTHLHGTWEQWQVPHLLLRTWHKLSSWSGHLKLLQAIIWHRGVSDLVELFLAILSPFSNYLKIYIYPSIVTYLTIGNPLKTGVSRPTVWERFCYRIMHTYCGGKVGLFYVLLLYSPLEERIPSKYVLQ